MGSCFVFTEVSKSILDKVIKPGRHGKDNMGQVEGKLKGEASQPGVTVYSAAPGQGFSASVLLAFGVTNFFVAHSLWSCALWEVQQHPSVASTHYMPTVTFQFQQPNLFLDIARCPLEGKCFHVPPPTALQGCTLSYVLKKIRKFKKVKDKQ